MLHSDARTAWLRRQKPFDDAIERAAMSGIAHRPAFPGIGEPSRRIERRHLATDRSVPIAHRLRPKRELSAEARLEVILHQLLFDQVRLGERAPNLLRRMQHHALDDDGARGGELFAHWSILLSRSSRPSNRLSQNPFICPVQSISGLKARTSAR